MSRCQHFVKTEVENVGWVETSDWESTSLSCRGLLPLISSPKHSCGVSPTHPNKGTNDFNYGVIAESGVN